MIKMINKNVILPYILECGAKCSNRMNIVWPENPENSESHEIQNPKTASIRLMWSSYK